MRRDFNLQPNSAVGKPLGFTWDEVTGEIDGSGADRVIKELDYAIAAGEVSSHPRPTTYKIKDPYHDAADLAAVLSQYWQLDDWLAARMPQKPDTTPTEELPPGAYFLH